MKETNIKCQNCGKEWFTKSSYILVSCPKCGSKVKNVKINKSEKSFIDMEKKSKIKYVYHKKVLKTQNVCGVGKGEINQTMSQLSEQHNIPVGEIFVEFD